MATRQGPGSTAVQSSDGRTAPLALFMSLARRVRAPVNLSARAQALLEAAARQGSRPSTLGANLLDLERVEGGKPKLDWQDVDVERLSL